MIRPLEDGRRELTGTLQSCDRENVIVAENDTEITLPLSGIAFVRLADFDEDEIKHAAEDSADKRSAENYRRAVKNAIAKENLNGNRVFPDQCTVIESGENQGNLNCTMPSGNSQVIKIKIEGNTPKRGTIVFEEGEPTQTTLYYKDVYVVIDAKGNSEIYKITSNNNTN